MDSQETATFQALSKLSGPGQVVLNKMSDEQLSKVEGEGWRRSFNFQQNNSNIQFLNVAVCSAFCSNNTYIRVDQTNVSR